MGTSTTSARTYKPNAAALMPGSAVRGIIIAIVDVPVVVLLAAYLGKAVGGTGLDQLLVGLYLVFGLGGVLIPAFMLPVLASILLALAGYSRREYELGEKGITERRGLLFSEETFLPYEDVDEVIYTQGKIQSFYNTGTIRVVDLDEDGDVKRQMQLSYIGNPEDVYTNVFRNVAEATEYRSRAAERPEIGELPTESEFVSRFSGDSLAAGTGFRHLMPSAIVHPNPGAAARYGMMMAVPYSAVGAYILDFISPVLDWALYIPSVWYFRGLLVLGAVATAVVLAGWYYWKYDRMQYELYGDHVRIIKGGERSTVALEDVARLGRDEGHLDNDVGYVALLNEKGDELLVMEFIDRFDEVYESLDSWIGSTE